MNVTNAHKFVSTSLDLTRKTEFVRAKTHLNATRR